MIDLTIVFVTFKSSQLLDSMLRPLSGHEVLIFDNNSEDDIAQRCHQKFPSVQVESNKINIGYGRAANAAFRNIQTPFALLINPDVEIDPVHVEALVKHAAQTPGDWLYIAPNTGHTVTTLDTAVGSPLRRITHATGCALLFNLENFKKLGGFDENIFLYYEEMDLSIRAHEQGFKMYYAEGVYFPHNPKQSVANSDKLESTRNWHFQWSSLYYKKKHGLWAHFAESVIKNLAISPFKQIFAAEEKVERYRIKRQATIDFLKGKPAFLKTGQPYIPD